ncbi:GNAT family N-acetyltransferase [Mycoplasma sp. P36-A1]|uniref:GNAT family N-acetyltransferase n=1 Tax=Mycoplasma sp. P36-A1 TaxID=3252900 RepID=UPI003C3075C9
MNIKIIKDSEEYEGDIDKVIKETFEQDDEANLVKQIRKISNFYLSYIAIDLDAKNKVVGHIMVSEMLLNNESIILSLAPVSVAKEYQNYGVGSKLIKCVIKETMKYQDKYKLLSVLGSEHYYQRFGFESFDLKKFSIPFEVEPRFFQLLELEKDCLKYLSGKFDYPEYYKD